MTLYTDHLEIGDGIEHTRFHQLREFDHRPEYVDVRVVPSASSDKTYLVARVVTLPRPFGPETTDIAADRVEVILCSCPAFWYQESGGFEDGDNPPDEWGRCKHGISAYRADRAQADENQSELDL